MRDWLFDARTEKKLTMAVIASKLGISESYYCAIEGGSRQVKMSMDLAAKLSDVLNISINRISDFEIAATQKEHP